jgi:hypothetical protein
LVLGFSRGFKPKEEFSSTYVTCKEESASQDVMESSIHEEELSRNLA